MTCKYIDLSSSPYDDSTVGDTYDNSDCGGVGNHFESNQISIGDCIEINGQAYRVTAVKVLCDGSEIYGRGDPGGAGPGHSHNFNQSPVTIQFWLSPMASEELSNCSGYS